MLIHYILFYNIYKYLIYHLNIENQADSGFFSSVLTLARAFVTFTLNCCALLTSCAFNFYIFHTLTFALTLCAISAQ